MVDWVFLFSLDLFQEVQVFNIGMIEFYCLIINMM